MTPFFTLHPKARREILQAIEYIEEQRTGYGNLLNEQIDLAIQAILANPNRFPVVQKEQNRRRKILSKPFEKAYSIYYDFDGESLRIIGFFHQRQSLSDLEDRV